MKTVEEKFWSKVNINNNNECWEWTGFKEHKGYGKFVALNQQLAHRVSWILHFGDIPEGLLVCHKCDNPSCVNPEHLFLGTVLDNNRDRNNKGRTVVPRLRGSNHAHSKLTEDDVREILVLHNNGASNKEIIKRINKVNGSVISEVIHRKLWGHVNL